MIGTPIVEGLPDVNFHANAIWSNRAWRLAAWAVAIVCAVRLGVHAYLIAAPQEWVATSLTIDDTYYYLQTAWNHVRLGFPTFDGVHPTNGVQFLWYWCCVLLAALAPTRDALLSLALSACAALNAACFVLIWRLARIVGWPGLAVAGSLVWYQATSTAYLSAMENSLHAFLIFWLVTELVAGLVRGGTPVRAWLTRLSVLSVLVVWARLDSALVVAPLFALAVWRARREGWGARVPAALVAVAGACVQFAGYYWMAGSAIPVSGLLKVGGYRIGRISISQIVGQTLTMSTFYVPTAVFWSAVLVGLASGWVVVQRKAVSPHRQALAAWAAILAVFAGASAALLVYLSGLWDADYSIWCRSPAIVAAVLVGGTGLALLAEAIYRRLLVRTPLALLIPVGLTWALATTATGEVRTRQEAPEGGQLLRYRTALWIRQNLPADVVLANENTGIIGYFSERRCINLDGLINSPEYARDVLERPDRSDRMIAYLERERVDYLVDLDTFPWATPLWPPASFTSQLPRLHRFLEGTGESAVGSLVVLDLKRRLGER